MKKMPKKSRIFKSAWFQRFAKREKITDDFLEKAVSDAEKGLIDADLGGNVIKQRISRQGQGKSGGYRTIIFFKEGEKAFFIYGYAKNARENIDKNELKAFKEAAKEMLKLSDEQIEQLVQTNDLTEVL
jgi:hypothetical protein